MVQRLIRFFLVIGVGFLVIFAAKTYSSRQTPPISLPKLKVIKNLEQLGDKVLGDIEEKLPGAPGLNDLNEEPELQTSVSQENSEDPNASQESSSSEPINQPVENLEKQTEDLVESIKKLPEDQIEAIKKQFFKEFCQEFCSE